MKRLFVFANGIFGLRPGGGDIHLANMLQSVDREIHLFGGHAVGKLYGELAEFDYRLHLTDSHMASPASQIGLFWDFLKRMASTLRQLGAVKPDDVAYAMSDGWWDVIPLALCASRKRILYLGMMAPSLKEIALRSRGDVGFWRVSSLHYWASQKLGLFLFGQCHGRKLVTYSHPDMLAYLEEFGFEREAAHYVPNGADTWTAQRVPDQPKKFDVAWIGRVHPQKGIEDLIHLLQWQKSRNDSFRAVIIGGSDAELRPRIGALGLSSNVTFSGCVSEFRKFALLKSSRVFVMPSHYESYGIVVAEALVAGIPVVAYDLPCYRPVFGDHIHYVACHHRNQFCQTVDRVLRMPQQPVDHEFARSLSWQAAQREFNKAIARIES